VECFQIAFDAATACRKEGGGLLECAEAFAAALSACREAAGCETPDRPPLCGEDCLTAARTAARACREAGGDIAACFAELKTQLKTCLEAAGCEIPPPPDRPPHCGAGCLRESLTAARDCLKDGGDFRTCAGTFRAAFEACREAAGCADGDDPPPEDDAEVLPLLLEQSFLRGDANSDGTVDISDPIAVLGFLFVGSEPPACMDSADSNDDGAVDIADPVMTLFTLFKESVPLPEPYPNDGFDPTDDSFGCGLPY
jgi:hypothetical protein